MCLLIFSFDQKLSFLGGVFMICDHSGHFCQDEIKSAPKVIDIDPSDPKSKTKTRREG